MNEFYLYKGIQAVRFGLRSPKTEKNGSFIKYL